ncbi:MAG: AAA family ATPase [Candidatus Uhrbacteria bacterium]|nr:AAA family ATPase [Candidatus Uhrbacteria bacterium]
MLHPLFSDVIGHETILRVLTHQAEHPAHGYLFHGPDGVGKRMVAERFVRAILDQPQELPLRAHPDFISLTREEDKKEISIKQTRELIERVSLTSARGGKQMVLIERADQLNEESANALLKSVEEPPPSLVYLFVTECPERLPATLRSRLVSIRFERMPSKRMPPQEKNAMENFSSLCATLIESPLGVSCAALEKLSQSCEAQEESEQAWREALQSLMRLCMELFATNPQKAISLGQGLTHAWQLIGTSLSPRLALEWAAVPSSIKKNISLPSFLDCPYL